MVVPLMSLIARQKKKKLASLDSWEDQVDTGEQIM